MTETAVNSMLYELFEAVVKLAGPVLIVSMIVGIVISIIQAATQIHEQTITFVPKLIVIGLMLLMMGDYMMSILGDFTVNIFNSMLV
ncbi:MAG: flagellar biosynthesis protein FliQ [Lacrimispora sp.]|uniref:flagellar biosynthesis protein FliQ n=1 Tax=Lacrimispora sp. TaxID=2719234 RepID=UPI0039E65019